MELLNEDRQNELLAQPESGMGYQDVEVVLLDGENRHGTVFNTEYLVYSGEPVDRLYGVSKPSELEGMLKRKELGRGEEIMELKVVPSEANVPSRIRESSETQTTSSSSGAAEAPEQVLANEEEFKRFSAFANDLRVTASGALRPGTDATTAEDAKQVKTGSGAVRRYALPNPMPAVNVLAIDPPVGRTVLKRGIALPAYGQPGGGVEVIFVNGSPDKTVTRRAPIPP